MKCQTHFRPGSLLVVCLSMLMAAPTVPAATKTELQRDARDVLDKLYARVPNARALGNSAAGVLVFPSVKKAGLVIGGQHGEGTLFTAGRVAGYYRTGAVSYGLQAGVQKFGYALFFMTERDLAYLRKSGGWEIGVGPNVVVVDKGVAKTLTTTTGRKGVYAFIFDQKGLMAGLGVQGVKITPINPKD